jgi:Alw26I/Eco31I/Esp3I family type II restriction m6 adenine DNA methyltransferase
MSTDTIKNTFRQTRLGLFEEGGLINHVEIAEKISSQFQGKNLAQKNSGKFYTPQEIALPLIDQIIKTADLNNRKGLVSIIDPFCGDGRLLNWLISKLTNKNLNLEIHLWDYDRDAVDYAYSEALKVSQNFKGNIKIYSKKVDSFSQFFKDNNEGRYDIVITNPPWEVVKPDSSELSKLLDKKTQEEYVNSLKDFSDRLNNDFPLSRPSKAYGGWGVNLARVGTELSVRLTKEGGVTALVTPSSIFADQNSSEIRKWMFEKNNLSSLNIFPAEFKLFKNVDQPSVSFILERLQKQKDLHISNYLNKDNIVISNVKELLEETGYILPVAIASSLGQIELLSSLSHFPQLSNLVETEQIWMGRELDETNHRSWLSVEGQHRFVKGRNVDRFLLENEANVFINQSVLKCAIPNSVNYHRVTWRDVSRPTQKRRVIATMIPPGYVTGNSLGVLYVRDSSNQEKLKALLGLISSFVFEFQLRAHLATAHVSAGVMRKMRIPEWTTKLEKEISSLVHERLNGNPLSEAKMEVFIAKSYGLTQDQFADVLSAFPKVTPEERCYLLDNKVWQ